MSKRQHCSLTAEASILGGIFLRPELLRQLDTLEVEDFYDPKHQSVFAAMRNLEASASPIDHVTVEAELQRMGKLDSLGGLAFLLTLTLNVPTPDNVMHYAAIVTKHRVTRDLRRAVAEIAEAIDSTDNEGDADTEGEGAVQWAQRTIGAVRTRQQDDGTITMAKLTRDRVAQLEAIAQERANGHKALTGITTGVETLDDMIGGYQIGIVTIIAARPGMGKSSLLRVALNAATKAGLGGHTFSVEDLRERFADRTLSSEANVPAENLRTCSLNRGQMEDVGHAVARLFRRTNWLVDDRPLTAMDAVRSWRRHGEKNATKVVAVDYLQRLRKRDYRMSDLEHVSESMDVLADAAKVDKVVCLVGSQLNRECEKRDNKRPQLSDMRAGGPIEEIAKCVIGLYRGSRYGPPIEGEDYEPGHRPTDDEWESTIELLLLKNSDGKEGRVLARWSGPTTSIS